MNFQAIAAIYTFEMARFFRTLKQSFISPVLSTSLYFVVFGTAIGSRMEAVDGVAYGAFIVPGLIMLSVMTQSISNASFGIYFRGTRHASMDLTTGDAKRLRSSDSCTPCTRSPCNMVSTTDLE